MSPFQFAHSLPQSVQGGATGASLFTMGAAFLEQIHGPVATLGVILGALWLAMQIANMAASWIQRWRGRGRSR